MWLGLYIVAIILYLGGNNSDTTYLLVMALCLIAGAIHRFCNILDKKQ